MKTITGITLENLSSYYSNLDGNLYWFNEGAGCWEIIDGFSEEDCKEAMMNNVQFVFMPGPAVSCFKIN